MIDETTAQIESIPGIMRVNAPTNVAETVTGIKRAVYICGSGIVIILLAVTLIIIANTIKVTVFNRRKEINIMKFVGATESVHSYAVCSRRYFAGRSFPPALPICFCGAVIPI